MMEMPIISAGMNADRVTEGEVRIRERSVELGDTVIVSDNIGTIVLQDTRKNRSPIIMGIALVLIGLTIKGLLGGFGMLLMLAGLVLILWSVLQQPESILSIGTCDGRRTNIVSRDRPGLSQLRSILRDKIERKDVGDATLTITGSQVQFHGGVVVGHHGTSTGRAGNIDNGADR